MVVRFEMNEACLFSIFSQIFKTSLFPCNTEMEETFLNVGVLSLWTMKRKRSQWRSHGLYPHSRPGRTSEAGQSSTGSSTDGRSQPAW